MRARGKHEKPEAEAAGRERKLDFSKRLISDIRVLLWLVTVGVLVLSFLCVFMGHTDDLPWLSVMVGLPWAAHGTVCSFYMNMAKSDHREGGITFESAKANNFTESEPEDGAAG